MDEKQEEEHVFCSEPNLAELLPLYVCGDVTQDEREKIEAHLATCPECQEDLHLFLDLKQVGKEVFCED